MSSSTRQYLKLLLYLAVSVGFVVAVILFAAAYAGVWTIPDAIELGPVSVRLYAVFIIAGVALAAWQIDRHKKLHPQLKQMQIDDILIWAVIPGLIGARLWHFVAEYPLYADNPVSVLYIWQGGITILGALAGGALGVVLYAKRHKLPPVKMLELGFVFVPLAQIVGRLGNFVNQELYGPVTDLPWGVHINATGLKHHPAFLYEQIGNAILFYLLYRLYRKFGLEGNGRLIAVYLAGYSLVRFSVDFVRLDRKIAFGLTSPQITALITVIIAAVYLLRLKINHAKN